MRSGSMLSGSLRLHLTSGDVSRVLSELATANVILYDVQIQSEISALFTIPSREYKKVKKIAIKCGSDLKIINRRGLIKIFSQLRSRILLLIGCFILLILTIFLPTRILFWEVTGNYSVPAKYIIEKVQDEGISFGTKRSKVRSEKIKNVILDEIPQLEWVGFTTSGCVVNISVREAQPEDKSEELLPGNIVAVCDGVVDSITVTRGKSICKPGQAVQQGQLLISGYEDCGFVIKHSGAQGEVYANTYRTLDGVVLLTAAQKSDLASTSHHISIRIGKKLIKLSKDSGISYGCCDKLYSERYVTLPGDLTLPMSLIVETVYYHKSCSASVDDVSGWLPNQSKSYLESQMLGGTVLEEELHTEYLDEVCQFRGAYRCKEQIGINTVEEILHYDENS